MNPSFHKRSFIFLLALFVLALAVPAAAHPAAQSGAPTGTVNGASRLNVRSGPAVGYGVVAVLSTWDVVTLLGRNLNASWAQVQTASGVQGWVNARYLLTSIPVANLPITSNTTPPPPTSGGTQRSYTVQAGDTLAIIAQRYGVTAQAIATANNLPNLNFIYVGQVLVIPSGSSSGNPGGYPVPTQSVYIVQPGDTVLAIAQRFGVSPFALAAANTVYNLNFIFVGQRLIIPAGGTYNPPPVTNPNPPPYTPPPAARTYVVQPGDNLYRIGLQFGLPWTSIAAANNIWNPNAIYAGQTLIIPW
jgi:LysM repeat protein